MNIIFHCQYYYHVVISIQATAPRSPVGSSSGCPCHTVFLFVCWLVCFLELLASYFSSLLLFFFFSCGELFKETSSLPEWSLKFDFLSYQGNLPGRIGRGKRFLYKLVMKAVKQDGQGSGRPRLGIKASPGMLRGLSQEASIYLQCMSHKPQRQGEGRGTCPPGM